MARRSFRRNSNLVNDYSDLYENGYSQYDEEYPRSSKYNDYDGDMRHLNRSSNHSRNKSSYKGSTGNTFKRFIIKQLVKLLLVVLLVIFTFLIIEATVTGDSIVDVYMSLTARVTQSNVNFDKRISFMSTDSEGNTTIQFGWKNEYTQSTGEVATDFAENNPGEPGTSGGGSSVQLSAGAEQVKQALIAGGYSEAKADGMATVYDLLNPTLGTNAAIGLMANVAAEGSYGVVEESFASSAASLFPGAAWHRTCVSKEGLEWLKAKGNGVSCGFGCVQWSYGRRMQLIAVYENVIGGSDTITDEYRAIAESMYMAQELSPGTSYYNTVSSHVSNDTAEEWAEAFCDYYEICAGCCYGEGHPRMSGQGSACVERRGNATNIANILSNM